MLAGSWLEESPERMTTYLHPMGSLKVFSQVRHSLSKLQTYTIQLHDTALHFVHCREWYNSNRDDFAYNRRCNLGTLKELLSCYKSQKNGVCVCFEVASTPHPPCNFTIPLSVRN
jgi:hypothetical protein